MANLKSVIPSQGKRPILLESRSSTWFITSTVCVATFTDIFLYAVIVPVFPYSLQTRIGVPESDVQHWLSILLAVYGAGLLVGAPICGIIADRTQYRKWPMLAGLVAVLGATILLCLARTITLLIIGRLLQGLSASVIWVVGLALLADTVESHEVATVMGYVGTMFSLGTLLAPLLGGIVYDRSGYYAVYAMCFGVIALDVIMRLVMIEKSRAAKWLDNNEHDKPRNLQSNDTLADHELESQDPKIINTVTEPPILEHTPITTNPDPSRSASLTPKRNLPPILLLLKSRRVLAAFWGTLAVAALTTGLDTTLTLFVLRTFNWDSLAVGLLFLALLFPSLFAPLFGKFVDRHGPRFLCAAGFLLTVPGFVLLRLVTHDSTSQKVLLVAMLVVVGTGLACAIPALLAEFTILCDAKERANPGLFGKKGAYAQSYGIFNVSWAAGSVIGAFWGGGVYGAGGWGTVTWTWALLAGVSALPVLLFTDGWIGKKFALGRRR